MKKTLYYLVIIASVFGLFGEWMIDFTLLGISVENSLIIHNVVCLILILAAFFLLLFSFFKKDLSIQKDRYSSLMQKALKTERNNHSLEVNTCELLMKIDLLKEELAAEKRLSSSRKANIAKLSKKLKNTK